MADTRDLGSRTERRKGSSPFRSTIKDIQMKVELPNGIIVEGSYDECRRAIDDFMHDRTISRTNCHDNDKLHPVNTGPHWWEMPPLVPYTFYATSY